MVLKLSKVPCFLFFCALVFFGAVFPSSTLLADEFPKILPSWNPPGPLPNEKTPRGAASFGPLLDLPQEFYRRVDREPDPASNGWLGISFRQMKPSGDSSFQDAPPAEIYFEITRVIAESPADRAGLKVGDRIEFDPAGTATQLDPLQNFRKQVSQTGVGETLPLKILRGDEMLNMNVVLEARPRASSPVRLDAGRERQRGSHPQSLIHHLLKAQGGTEPFSDMLQQMRLHSEAQVSPVIASGVDNPFRLEVVTQGLHRPLDLPILAEGMVQEVDSLWMEEVPSLERVLRTAAYRLNLPADAILPHPSSVQTWNAYWSGLEEAILRFSRQQQGNWKVPPQMDRIRYWIMSWLEFLKRAEDPPSQPDPQDSSSTQEFLKSALESGWMKRPLGVAELMQAVNLKWLMSQSGLGLQDMHFPNEWIFTETADRIVARTPIGRVIIGGPGPNTYDQDEQAVIILDLGGDDFYFNRAGGTGPGRPVSIVIDLEGDDAYFSAEPYAQGAGWFGAGILIDLKGNDRYSAGDLAQGVGVFGVGLLLDVEGRDRYQCSAFCQGAATFGVGLHADRQGHDDYRADILAQGAGLVKGFGMLTDARGNDRYRAGGLVPDHRQPEKATQSFAQGFGYGIRPFQSPAGASGGIGILSDLRGNDSYVADYFAQGSSYWLALGILSDAAGQDRYLAGRYSQGAGIHVSLGLLQDQEGDDLYETHFGVSQGLGHDFGAGFLLDGKGNDRYLSGVMAQGAGNANGLGFLIDRKGDDEYHARSLAQGRGHLDPLRGLGSFGFLFDTGGSDYFSAHHTNGKLTATGPFGFAADID